jgi:TolB-like protein
VLAFANLSDDKSNEYFSDGISEELLNVLAKIPGLKVSARTSAFYFKGKQVPIPEIAQKLGVAYVVEGSVRKSGSRVRITAQLIKAADGFHVWSENFDRELKDIFAVQDEIAGLIAQNLKLKLEVKSAVRLVNPAAYDLWLQGRTIFTRGNPRDYPKGIQHYKEALALEEDSAPTWAALAIGYAASAAQGELAVESGFALARTAANRALVLDADSAQAHYALGLVRFLADWDWAQADASYQRALALAPSDVTILSSAATLAQTACSKAGSRLPPRWSSGWNRIFSSSPAWRWCGTRRAGRRNPTLRSTS